MQRHVITIDGFAGSGKTTLAKRLADELNGCYLSSGLLYRGLGALALAHNVDPEDENELCRLLLSHSLTLQAPSGSDALSLYIDACECEFELYKPEVSEASSKVAQHPKVRKLLVDVQRGAAPERLLVAEGRDMGTVIFPDAPVKFFIRVSEATRRQRRMKQSKEHMSEEALKLEISERDQRDSQRNVSPVIPADDAIVIENEGARSVDEVIHEMKRASLQRLSG